MRSVSEAKRSKVEQTPFDSPLAPQDAFQAAITPKAITYPPSLLLRSPSPLLSNRSPEMLPSPLKSLNRDQLSPLLLPRIEMQRDDVECCCSTQNDEKENFHHFFPCPTVTQRPPPLFPNILKPKFTKPRVLAERMDNFADVAVELDSPDDDIFQQIRPLSMFADGDVFWLNDWVSNAHYSDNCSQCPFKKMWYHDETL